jgi:hypothetical protein
MALVKYNNNSISAITAASSLPTGAMTLIKEQTASASATISFVDGASDVVLDSTYPIYLFKLIDIHPATNNVQLQVNFRDGSTAYDATKTTTFFTALHGEDDADAEMGYIAADDVAQGTGIQKLTRGTGNGNDECCSGELWLFNPSSTTFVKHFMARVMDYNNNAQANEAHIAGYCNVTAAIDAVQFSFSSGNIDAGTFKLYGIKDS